MRRTLTWVAVLIGGLCACGDDDGVEVVDLCGLEGLPLSAAADGPVVTDVALEVQEGEGVVVLATATDPQGSPNLQGVTQSIAVFEDDGCVGPASLLEDDLAGSGVEESFGTAVDEATRADLVAEIAASTTWPVEVDFSDADGNRTAGRVGARVVR